MLVPLYVTKCFYLINLLSALSTVLLTLSLIALVPHAKQVRHSLFLIACHLLLLCLSSALSCGAAWLLRMYPHG